MRCAWLNSSRPQTTLWLEQPTSCLPLLCTAPSACTPSGAQVHRLLEAQKHGFATRVSLGDPGFPEPGPFAPNITEVVNDLLSDQFVDQVRRDPATLRLIS